MKHIELINTPVKRDHIACKECQTGCQSACKTSCTVGNQKCEAKKNA